MVEVSVWNINSSYCFIPSFFVLLWLLFNCVRTSQLSKLEIGSIWKLHFVATVNLVDGLLDQSLRERCL